ncbi:MAG: RdgB/HAM1 family non-canonical purine NTP pyrophosphatase [Nanoarchaeota archaeon]|nr:RdgB/HAM1 family non-canonical purine NTP pyrophosphatase [Nanoarchaeota archaeon]
MAQKRTLIFITGNKNKLREARGILKGFEVRDRDIDLPELQETSGALIVEDKIRRALKLVDDAVFVEDTGLYYDALGGLPGPFVKWFLERTGRRGLLDLLSAYDDKTAYAKCYIGYGIPARDRKKEKIIVFEGSVKGRMVEPAGESKFGFDPIFLPDGHDKTYAQMVEEEKNRISHRRLALEKLREYLEKHS